MECLQNALALCKRDDILTLQGGGSCAGAVHGTSWELEEVRGNAVKTMLTLAAISTVASLQVFGKDRLIFWRESAAGAAGLSPTPHNLGHALHTASAPSAGNNCNTCNGPPLQMCRCVMPALVAM